MAYFISIVMYKPAALSMWMVLMATSHLAYWKRIKDTPPKEQRGILPGKTELPDNYVSAWIVNVTLVIFGCWFITALYFLPLTILFLPVTFMVLFGIPGIFMKLPVHILNGWGDLRIFAQHELEEDGEMICSGPVLKEDTAILELKVTGAASVVMFVFAASLGDFWYEPNLAAWWDILSSAVSDMAFNVSFSLEIWDLSSLSVSFSWPSEMPMVGQLPLFVSAGLLCIRTVEKIFKHVYRVNEIEKWGLNKIPWRERSAHNTAKSMLDWMLLFPARINAALFEWYDQSRFKLKFLRLQDQDQDQDKDQDKDQVLDFVDDAILADYVSNNEDMKRIDLSNCPNITILPDAFSSLRRLRKVNFKGTGLKGVITLPSCVLELDESAFEGLDDLEEVHAPGLRIIRRRAFKSCKSLKRVVCRNVKEVHEEAFAGCVELESVILRIAKKRFGPDCFSGCLKLIPPEVFRQDGLNTINEGTSSRISIDDIDLNSPRQVRAWEKKGKEDNKKSTLLVNKRGDVDEDDKQSACCARVLCCKKSHTVPDEYDESDNPIYASDHKGEGANENELGDEKLVITAQIMYDQDLALKHLIKERILRPLNSETIKSAVQDWFVDPGGKVRVTERQAWKTRYSYFNKPCRYFPS